uniref:Novel STAND NTPase 3 domain-containing protein n=1 Tax=Magallana gigas TaxID=29159 RepID=K1PUV6_MAGGI
MLARTRLYTEHKFWRELASSTEHTSDECVILNAQTHNMDSVDCKADTGCPKDLYLPSDLWRYKICYENFYGISEGNGSGTGVGVVVAVVIILIIVVVVMVVFYVRNLFGFKDKVQQRITTTAEIGEAQSTHVPLLEEKKATNTSDIAGGIKEEVQKGIKLNPDCTVAKGIVITENITTTLRLLKSRNVVILKGVIGCGKTHALKAIQSHFQGKDLRTEWVESEIVQEDISTKRPTILLCDNLFGQFGSCVFSQTDVEKTEKTLGAIEGAGDNIKVVIGIHTHLFQFYQIHLSFAIKEGSCLVVFIVSFFQKALGFLGFNV